MEATSTSDFESHFHTTAQSLNTFHIGSYGMSFNTRNKAGHEAHGPWAACCLPDPILRGAVVAATHVTPHCTLRGDNGGEMAEFMAATTS
jgi:hypothetical protein